MRENRTYSLSGGWWPARKCATSDPTAEVASTPRGAESSNAGTRLRDSMTGLAVNSASPYGMTRATARWRGGTDLPRSRRLYQSRHLARNGPWRLTALNRVKKPPYTASTYGGVGGRGREAPPTRSNRALDQRQARGFAARPALTGLYST